MPVRNLHLYNTLTHRKERFAPIDPGNVRVYACGPTVYDFLHIGNGRMLVVFDVLFRILRHVYGEANVTYVRNITDVEDKINARAAERGVDIRVLTDEMTAIFHEDARALGCLPPTVEPRATEHMREMTAIIERLVERRHAYVANDHVLFSIGSMPQYGALSRRSLDEMVAGARVEVAPYKRDPVDFVLWKPSVGNEPSWPSPAGIARPGRPGWHIECSAMAWKHLGEVFDIHGGGIDLVFPHHENEVAQTRCAFGHEVMANVWMHNGHLQVEGEKMSKSLGNFVTIRDLWAGKGFGGRSWPTEVLRLAILRTHYRQPMDWTVKSLDDAERTLDRWYDTIGDVGPTAADREVVDALSDDLNVPAALTEMHRPELSDPAVLKASANVLGLLVQTRTEWKARQRRSAGIDEGEVERLIARRRAARESRDWGESDRIRRELAAMNVVVKDNKDGTTTWDVAAGSKSPPRPPVAPAPEAPTRIDPPAGNDPNDETARGPASDLAVDPSLPGRKPDVGPE
jgi:cysteinyl-tRNA synthetase